VNTQERGEVCVVKLAFSDGTLVDVPVQAGETVLESARRQGVMLRSECELGMCGTCKASCPQGDYILDSTAGLTFMEQRRRRVLTCVMRPASSCTVEIPHPPLGPRTVAGVMWQGMLSELEMVGQDVCRATITLAAGATLPFLPGQYANIAVPGASAFRSYSFANAPGDPKLEFLIRLVPGGRMSSYLLSARPGDLMELEGPFGFFNITDANRPILMVAGGTGIAPMLSMLQHLLNHGVVSNRMRLLLGTSLRPPDFCVERLELYRRRFGAFSYELTVSRPSATWTGRAGYVTGLLNESDIAGEDTDIYVCGPLAMTVSTQSWLEQHGVCERRIHTETFRAS
jgi:benzoate/toluate 1,2-dioxygenase reductase subunit